MKNFFAFLISFLSVFLFIRCNKNSDDEPQPTKTELMTSSAWKLEDVGFDNNKDGAIDISGMLALSTCQTDNTLSFNTNNSGVTDEGAIKCNATDPQTSNFNWNFADAEANINVSNSVLAQLNGKSKVVALTSTNFTLSRDTTISGVGSGWIVVKLRH